MAKHRYLAVFTVLISLSLFIIGCSEASSAPVKEPVPPKFSKVEKLYTAHNIWFEHPEKIYSINYKKGAILPVGTEVTRVRVGRGKITFRANGLRFRIYFNPRWHPGQSTKVLQQQLFTTKSLDEMTQGMSEEKISYLRTGTPMEGMTRQEILMTYGYPPRHGTPGLFSNQWVYWRDRVRTKRICFDETGLATRECDLTRPKAL